MNRPVRLFLALIILGASIALLVWAYLPNPRDTRIQPISPSEMQLPTPSSLHMYPQPAA